MRKLVTISKRDEDPVVGLDFCHDGLSFVPGQAKPFVNGTIGSDQLVSAEDLGFDLIGEFVRYRSKKVQFAIDTEVGVLRHAIESSFSVPLLQQKPQEVSANEKWLVRQFAAFLVQP